MGVKGSCCLSPLSSELVAAPWTVEGPSNMLEELSVLTLSHQFAQSKRFQVCYLIKYISFCVSTCKANSKLKKKKITLILSQSSKWFLEPLSFKYCDTGEPIKTSLTDVFEWLQQSLGVGREDWLRAAEV